ncbi:hypothetical protein CRE_14514 [Caenorhabditis remanei]|uniref:C2H2-type domain-containing protein n=1 Tax=Caenorhabditis remanei TaxID=31234 RepID=E3M9A7_CAERE|nr:hypothetical protein CRE_14514 [Caenorhabditis remanei]
MADPEKQFECNICHKSFPSLYALNSHKVIHTGERPFVCDVCGSNFSFSSNLSRHRLIHFEKNTEKYSSSNTNKPQFSFDEDIRQIAHQLSRVATARPDAHDALREVMFGTILAFGNGGFNDNVGEFFKKLSDRYNN